jgi:hypothetical protein
MSAAENTLYFQIKATGLPLPCREYRFAAEHVGLGAGVRARLMESRLKDWRFDFAWPSHKFACEVEGGGGMGRHTTAKGFRQDIEKYHHAMALGWTVYRCDAALVRNGMSVALIERLLAA